MLPGPPSGGDECWKSFSFWSHKQLVGGGGGGKELLLLSKYGGTGGSGGGTGYFQVVVDLQTKDLLDGAFHQIIQEMLVDQHKVVAVVVPVVLTS